MLPSSSRSGGLSLSTSCSSASAASLGSLSIEPSAHCRSSSARSGA
jgi:hypothetical protein